MTKEQKETIEMLLSEIDDLEYTFDNYKDSDKESWIVFSGTNVDGPTCGYIKADGSVLWMA